MLVSFTTIFHKLSCSYCLEVTSFSDGSTSIGNDCYGEEKKRQLTMVQFISFLRF